MSKRISQTQFEEKFNKKWGYKFKVIGEYKKWNIPISIQCNKCKEIIDYKTPNNIMYSKNLCCPICDSKLCTKKIIIGESDMWSTHPNIAKLLLNPDDGYRYKINTTQKLNFICPKCKKINNLKASSINKNGFSCKFCGDGISYPNKFIANLLKNRTDKFELEYKISGYNYRYDSYIFEFNKKILVELDGAYGHGCIDTSKMSKEQQILIDNEKEKIAKDNGFEFIRIDCKYSSLNERYEYVKNSIFKSNLQNLFNFTEEEYMEANNYACQSIIYLISDDWNNNCNTYDKYYEKYKIKRPGIRRFLNAACQLGLISSSYEEVLNIIRLGSNKKISVSKGFKIMCNETGVIYNSIAEAQRNTNTFSINEYLKGRRHSAGKLEDGTPLTWTIL